MTVGPAHGGLDCEMQPVEPDVERHFNPAQNLPNHEGLGKCDASRGSTSAGSVILKRWASIKRTMNPDATCISRQLQPSLQTNFASYSF
jgi:hypothetical protein